MLRFGQAMIDVALGAGATTIASSAIDSTVDLASLGPVGMSASEVRRFHLATVFWLTPLRLARPLRLS